MKKNLTAQLVINFWFRRQKYSSSQMLSKNRIWKQWYFGLIFGLSTLQILGFSVEWKSLDAQIKIYYAEHGFIASV